MKLSEFDYDLPPGLVAQRPLPGRGDSRLMHLPASARPRHLQFSDLPSLLHPGDLVVVNETRVIPARLRLVIDGREGEILLLHPLGGDQWDALVRPGRRLRPGRVIELGEGLVCEVLEENHDGSRRVRFAPAGRLEMVLERLGEMPLPPYIHEPLADPERYQTVYARTPGSAAAPTAGLHFDVGMLDHLARLGVDVAPLTLRIGLDTFRPIRSDDLEDHVMHSEAYEVPGSTRAAMAATRERGGRVIAVGTTVARALESAAIAGSDSGQTDLFIRPGFEFREVDVLLTNFHLPRSTLLVMVAAFAGRERVLAAYREAAAAGYRFYSFGDAMLLERAR
ncbi:MAG: tRNA preQ1(34) S-adenosylmethionine ribosyltransferase-isomerase QueA [Candidatus Dormibacteria bacterium]